MLILQQKINTDLEFKGILGKNAALFFLNVLLLYYYLGHMVF